MGDVFYWSFSDWKMGEWIPVLLILVVLVMVAVLVWLESSNKGVKQVCACLAIVLAGSVVAAAAAQENAEERQQKQSEKAADSIVQLEIGLEAQQAYADLAEQQFPRPDSLSVSERKVVFKLVVFGRLKCTITLGLEKRPGLEGYYAVVFFQTDTPRPLSPDDLPRLADIGCPHPAA